VVEGPSCANPMPCRNSLRRFDRRGDWTIMKGIGCGEMRPSRNVLDDHVRWVKAASYVRATGSFRCGLRSCGVLRCDCHDGRCRARAQRCFSNHRRHHLYATKPAMFTALSTTGRRQPLISASARDDECARRWGVRRLSRPTATKILRKGYSARPDRHVLRSGTRLGSGTDVGGFHSGPIGLRGRRVQAMMGCVRYTAFARISHGCCHLDGQIVCHSDGRLRLPVARAQ